MTKSPTLSSRSKRPRCSVILLSLLLRRAKLLSLFFSYRMVEKLVGSGDNDSAMLVDLICSEETTHVEKGVNWFSYLCDKHSFDKELEFKTAIKKYVPGGELLPPFNVWAREQAGMNPEMYMSSAAKRNQMEVQPTNNCVKVSEKRHIYKNSTWLKNQLHQLDKE